MSKYRPTIGLEIHVELATRAKMFCDCKNDPNEPHPNVNVCPICLGHPGTLPVPNKEAIKHILKIGLALQGTLAGISKFDRKNYFYPDLPKGYQISQFDLPFVSGGEFGGVKITRVHLEEDAGRLAHVISGSPKPNSLQERSSYVDFNRAGVPLMELVTEPVIHDSETAVNFAKELQLILRYLGASEADMEHGQMRLEANISISKDNNFGIKVEVKNLNSFKVLHDAIEYEILRQTAALENGEKIKQETRGWDDVKQKTISQRSKEEAHDYRYFPEPDIPPLNVPKLFNIQELLTEIPELPENKRRRFAEEFNLSEDKIDILIRDKAFADYFEEAASELGTFYEDLEPAAKVSDYNLLYSYLVNDLRGLLIDWAYSLSDLKFGPESFAHLLFFVYTGKVGSRAAKDILKKMVETGADPEDISRDEGLSQISGESELLDVVRKVIDENQDIAASFKKGKVNAIQALIGKAMGKLKGAGNPQILLKLFKEELTK